MSPNVLPGQLRSMSVRLARAKHNSVSLQTDQSNVFPLWMSTDERLYGNMTIMLGLTGSYMTERARWHS